ncbi:hypothetical protein [Terriglobus sp.]|uniref:hypothetical protein n=1 Tax=Terriglobus sp. TaxID=1889013 RepID=UPI003AFF6C58
MPLSAARKRKKMNDRQVDSTRLEAIERYAILDQEREAAFDDIVQIACGILGTSSGMITLVNAERQWFLSEKVSEPGKPRWKEASAPWR